MSDADFGSKFTHQVYEVLSEDTKKYTSTTVGGGGGSVSGYGGYVSGSTNAVTSRVDYHSDQSVWVKNVDTGKERKFQLNTFNIDVRPGHKVLCVWDKKADRLERVVNLNTGDISEADGVCRLYKEIPTSSLKEMGLIFLGLFVPLLGWLMLFVTGWKMSMNKGILFDKDKMPDLMSDILFIKKFFIISPVIMVVIALLMPYFVVSGFLYFIVPVIGAILGSGLLSNQYKSEMLIKQSTVSAFDDYIDSITKKYASS